jgi:hypothetical protein
MEMEETSLYSYYCETKFIKISEAKNLAIEYFEYTEQHLFHRIEAVVCQTTAAVPTFSWNWICSTRCFLMPILNTIDEYASDHHKKEEYAFRFLLLFVPFRSKEDLETDEFYQGALQRAYRKGRISEEMIQIAENIQTLHNSLASDMWKTHFPPKPCSRKPVISKSQMKTMTMTMTMKMTTTKIFWLASENRTLP